MKENETTVSTVEKFPYQFTAIPTNLIYVLDSDCFKFFSFLIQKETYWKNKNRLDADGYFFLTIEDISKVLNISDRKDIRCVIEALYSNNLIDVQCIKVKGRNTPNKFKINWNKVLEYNEYSMFDINEFGIKINKLNRNSSITYDNSKQDSTQNASDYALNKFNNSKQFATTTTIDNINNIYNIEDINNIYNKKEKDIIINNNIQKERKIEMKEEKTNEAFLKAMEEDNTSIKGKLLPTKESLTENLKTTEITIPTDILEELKKKNSYIYSLLIFFNKGELTKEELIEKFNSYRKDYSKPYELIKDYILSIEECLNMEFLNSVKDDNNSIKGNVLPSKENSTESLKMNKSPMKEYSMSEFYKLKGIEDKEI